MNRQQLAHILRAAFDAVGDSQMLVIGSQSILGSFREQELPEGTMMSIEADVLFFNDPDESKMDELSGAIGELTQFHETHGIYGQGVSLETATLPQGWKDRLVPFAEEGSPQGPSCLEPHDLAASKLVAGRQKDKEFTKELLRAGLIKAEILIRRLETLDVSPPMKRGLVAWVRGVDP